MTFPQKVTYSTITLNRWDLVPPIDAKYMNSLMFDGVKYFAVIEIVASSLEEAESTTTLTFKQVCKQIEHREALRDKAAMLAVSRTVSQGGSIQKKVWIMHYECLAKELPQ